MTEMTITMRLMKEHKTLAEYAEVTESGEPVKKPLIMPIYIRKPTWLEGGYPLPSTIEITLTAIQN